MPKYFYDCSLIQLFVETARPYLLSNIFAIYLQSNVFQSYNQLALADMNHIYWSKDAAGPFMAIPNKDSDSLTSLNGLISVLKRQLGLKEDLQIFSKKGMSQVRIDTQEKYDQIRKNNPKIKLIIKSNQFSQRQSLEQPEKLQNISISEVPNSDDLSSSNLDYSGLELFSEKSRLSISKEKGSQKVEEKTQNSSQNQNLYSVGKNAHISRNGKQNPRKNPIKVPSANQGCACSTIENEEFVFVCYIQSKEQYKVICSSCHKKGNYAISMCMNLEAFKQMRRNEYRVLTFVVATTKGLINGKGDFDKVGVNGEQIKQRCNNLEEHQDSLAEQNSLLSKEILHELKQKDPNSRIRDFHIMLILSKLNIKDRERRKQEAIEQLLRERFP